MQHVPQRSHWVFNPASGIIDGCHGVRPVKHLSASAGKSFIGELINGNSSSLCCRLPHSFYHRISRNAEIGKQIFYGSGGAEMVQSDNCAV
jgi:hypothetical protein